MDLVPGEGLGPFKLGTPIGVVIRLLLEQYRLYKNVHLVYGNRPKDILVQLDDAGVLLKFDSVTQQLKRIDFIPTKSLRLRFGAKPLDNWDEQGFFQSIRDRFGPCREDNDASGDMHFLRYPGVVFAFHTQKQDGNAEHISKSKLAFGSVISGQDFKATVPPNYGQFYGERVIVSEGQGLFFERRGKLMSFGNTCQQIISTFGPPSDTYYQGDITRVHAYNETTRPHGGFFFNYHALGVDILFSEADYCAIKFVLHANTPGHFNFNSHLKCNFFCTLHDLKPKSLCHDTVSTKPSIQVPESSSNSVQFETVNIEDEVDPAASIATKKKKKKKKSRPSIDAKASIEAVVDTQKPTVLEETAGQTLKAPAQNEYSNERSTTVDNCAEILENVLQISPETRWSEVTRGYELVDPVLLQPATTSNSSNPYGATYAWNIGSFIFEVTGSDTVSTVTLFHQR